FKRVMEETLKNIRWSKHWFFESQERAVALQTKNYSLNMLVEWLTPSTEELIPVLDADEEAKLRYIQLIRKRRFLAN
ncbi:jg5079, partial [Pararge aegeria aegeria]